METAKPRQSLTGIVGADEKRVWGALLETSPYLTPRMREMITGSPGVLRFPARPAGGQTETSPVPGVNVEADNDARTLAISGQWWFRGVYSMIPQGPDTLLRYQVFNAAPGATLARATGSQARAAGKCPATVRADPHSYRFPARPPVPSRGLTALLSCTHRAGTHPDQSPDPVWGFARVADVEPASSRLFWPAVAGC